MLIVLTDVHVREGGYSVPTVSYFDRIDYKGSVDAVCSFLFDHPTHHRLLFVRSYIMGAVASCLSTIVSAIGRGIMAVLHGVVAVVGSM